METRQDGSAGTTQKERTAAVGGRPKFRLFDLSLISAPLLVVAVLCTLYIYHSLPMTSSDLVVKDGLGFQLITPNRISASTEALGQQKLYASLRNVSKRPISLLNHAGQIRLVFEDRSGRALSHLCNYNAIDFVARDVRHVHVLLPGETLIIVVWAYPDPGRLEPGNYTVRAEYFLGKDIVEPHTWRGLSSAAEAWNGGVISSNRVRVTLNRIKF